MRLTTKTNTQDYHAFGSVMAGRSFSNANYRFGFNGKEEDIEGMGGGGSTLDYGFRIYNSHLGKFLSVDPLTQSYPWYTPYQFAGNTPIWAIDLDGLEVLIFESFVIPRTFINIPQIKVVPIPVPPGPIIPPIVLPMPTDIPIEIIQPIEKIDEINWEFPPQGPEELGVDWEETTNNDNPSGSRDFKNKKTGEDIRYDPSKSDLKTKKETKVHWHRMNPNSKGKKDKYLNKNGDPVPHNSPDAHIYPENIVLPTIKINANQKNPSKPKERNWFQKVVDKVIDFFTPSPPPNPNIA